MACFEGVIKQLIANEIPFDLSLSPDDGVHIEIPGTENNDINMKVFQREGKWYILDRGQIYLVKNPLAITDIYKNIDSLGGKGRHSFIMRDCGISKVFLHPWSEAASNETTLLLDRYGWVLLSDIEELSHWEKIESVFNFNTREVGDSHTGLNLPVPHYKMSCSDFTMATGVNDAPLESSDRYLKDIISNVATSSGSAELFYMDINHNCYKCSKNSWDLEYHLWPTNLIPSSGLVFFVSGNFSDGMISDAVSMTIYFLGEAVDFARRIAR